jgi:hypothetical protein
MDRQIKNYSAQIAAIRSSEASSAWVPSTITF